MSRDKSALLLIVVYFTCIETTELLNSTMASPKFLYFGYGSNLLAKRILLNNPTAIRRGPAQLMGYRLDFNGFTARWGGAVATIIPDDNRHVWGALWEMNSSDVGNLDRQEGVGSGIYKPIQITVKTPDGETLKARTYMYIRSSPPSPPQSNSSNLESVFKQIPLERRPSPEYRRVIIIGAYETGLPKDYIDALEMIPHNNYEGSSGLDVIPQEEFHRTGSPIIT